ncbi:MAG: type II secretion system protein M [Pseudomonadota bacterium]
MTRAELLRWFESLAPRDQRMLRVGGIAAAVIVLVGVLVPLQRMVSAASKRVEQKQTDLTWMRTALPSVVAAGPGPTSRATADSLVVLIDQSARESGLAKALAGSQPSGSGSQRVQLNAADFNLLVAWLSRLSSQHGVKVESATLTAAAAPGLVTATLVLRAP